MLDENLEASRKKDLTIITPFMQNEWNGFVQADEKEMLQKVDTTFSKEKLGEIAQTITTLPSDKKFISKIQKLINDRKEKYDNKRNVDGCIEFINHSYFPGYGDAGNFVVEPEVGKFYIFPAGLQHTVYPFGCDGIRRSMAINFY